jgi:hypothetical protein
MNPQTALAISIVVEVVWVGEKRNRFFWFHGRDKSSWIRSNEKVRGRRLLQLRWDAQFHTHPSIDWSTLVRKSVEFSFLLLRKQQIFDSFWTRYPSGMQIDWLADDTGEKIRGLFVPGESKYSTAFGQDIPASGIQIVVQTIRTRV